MANQDETILVALDYLLNYTDINHMSNASKINKYALDTYGLSIDHRCLNKFLKRLKDICDKYPDKFPFILESNENIRPRYYIEQKYFSIEDVISIASAIKDTFYIDEETSNDLIDKFIDVTVSQYQKDEVKEILSAQPNKNGKLSKTVLLKVNKIETAIKEKRQIRYCSKYSKNNEIERHYFYKIVYIGNEPTAIIIKDGKLISEFVKNIKIISLEESWYDDPRCRFKISDEYKGNYKTADEEIDDVIVPVSNTAITRICSFSFPSTPYAIDLVKESFENFFKKKLSYEIKNNKCYSQIKIKIDIFLMWITQFDIANLVDVIGDEDVLKGLEIHYKSIIHRNNLNKY